MEEQQAHGLITGPWTGELYQERTQTPEARHFSSEQEACYIGSLSCLYM